MKTICTILIHILSFYVVPVTAQTFHLIVIADNKDPAIGKGCEIDQWTMFAQMKEIAEKTKYKFNFISIDNEDFRLGHIKSTIEELSCEPTDIVFLYYTGHGMNLAERKSKWPLMRIKSNDNVYALDDVHEKLKSKNPQLVITLGDMCNELTNAPVASLQSKGIIVEEVEPQNETKIYLMLFTDYKGDVLISSSSKGEWAWSTKYGSLYTQQFQEALNNAANYNSSITWEALLADTENRLHHAISKLGKEQNPQMELHVDVNTSPTDVAENNNENETNNQPLNENEESQPELNKTDAQETEKTDSIPSETNEKKQPQNKQKINKPAVTYQEINKYLNSLINNSIPDKKRYAMLNQYGEYFSKRAKVYIYVNRVSTDLLPIEEYIKQKYMNNDKIARINFIENKSKFNYDENKYTEISVQELWVK